MSPHFLTSASSNSWLLKTQDPPAVIQPLCSKGVWGWCSSSMSHCDWGSGCGHTRHTPTGLKEAVSSRSSTKHDVFSDSRQFCVLALSLPQERSCGVRILFSESVSRRPGSISTEDTQGVVTQEVRSTCLIPQATIPFYGNALPINGVLVDR